MKKFSKECFSQTIKKVHSKYRNQREFAKISNISRTYLSQYMNLKLDEPPKPEILRRLANASKGITTYQQLMRICGYLDESETIITENQNKIDLIFELANGLSVKEINDLIAKLNKAKVDTR